VGARVRDLRTVLRYLRARPDIDAQRLGLWGDSFARTNPRETKLAVPFDAVDQPLVAEPLGGLLVLFAALFENDIRAVSIRGGLVSYGSLLDSPFVYVPHEIIVPGALTAGDLGDVAAAIAPCSLRIDDVVDGQNRQVTEDEAALAFSMVKESYAGGLSTRLSLPGSRTTSIATWFQKSLRPD
jgi:hypothetical protein